MFIRTKKFGKKEYAYLVENKWTIKGSRQKVSKYLGRIVKPDKIKEENFNFNSEKEGSEIIQDLVKWQLLNHGFEEIAQNILCFDSIFVDLNEKKVFLKKKEENILGAVKINDSFLCDYTLASLFNTKIEGELEDSGKKFAEAFSIAGIPVEKDVFVELFRKVYGSR